jgi:hypothetical protein
LPAKRQLTLPVLLSSFDRDPEDTMTIWCKCEYVQNGEYETKLSMTDQQTLFTLTEAFQASFTAFTRPLIADSLADPAHILCFSISRIALPIPDDNTMDLVTGKSLILERR